MQIPSDVLNNIVTVKPTVTQWRSAPRDNGELALWAFRRNYKASFTSLNGAVTGYAIHELSDRTNKPKLVLLVKDVKLRETDVKRRCETIIRVLAKGHDLRLTPIEQTNGSFNKEHVVFIPYAEK